LCAAVLNLIEHLPDVPADMRRPLSDLAESLRGPLRLAVAGRIKQGKSTVVNALLGQRAAATDAGECTRVVTWFRWGYPERATVRLSDGTAIPLPLMGGVLGGSLPPEAEAGTAGPMIEVELSNEVLASLTIIDTPGFGSANTEISQLARDLLFDGDSTGLVQAADAVLFVLDWRLVDEERQMLRALAARFGTEFGLAVSTLGVLNQRDLQYSPQEVAQRCASHAASLRDFLGGVVPVVALLAQTATGGVLTEADARAIAELAGQPDEDLRRWLRTVERFRDGAVILPERVRARLLEDVLGLHGIRQAIQLYKEGCRGAVALTAALAERSGINGLRQALQDEIRENADALRAGRALRLLSDLSFRPTGGSDREFAEELRGRAEQLRLAPLMHRLDEREARHAVLRSAVPLPDRWAADLLRVTLPVPVSARLGGQTDADAATLRQLAADGAAGWRGYALTCGDLDREKIAEIAARSYEIIFHELGATMAGAGT
jgi:hypothetical protein